MARFHEPHEWPENCQEVSRRVSSCVRLHQLCLCRQGRGRTIHAGRHRTQEDKESDQRKVRPKGEAVLTNSSYGGKARCERVSQFFAQTPAKHACRTTENRGDP